MKIDTFEMERWQSKWEHSVKYNLSESGVHPLTMEEFVPKADRETLDKVRLGYIQTDGTAELKDRISRIYPNSTNDNILVTTGSIEANYLLIWSLVEPGDQAVFMLPNFLQIQGLLHAFGANIKPLYLKEEINWQPDIEELKKTVSKDTKFIILTNPNNPSGSQLSAEVRDTILDVARWAEAWLISDEVYQGAELDGVITPSFWGSYEKVIVTSGLSKAYGLPGLRLGWMVGPVDLIDKVWRYKDYTSITVGAVNDWLARIVLKEDIRLKILGRTRSIINSNLSIMDSWLKGQNDFFTYIPPKAGAIVFLSYSFDMNSTQLALRLLEKKSVLICPGDHYGVDHHIRIGLGEETERFVEGLRHMEEGLNAIRDNSL